MLTVVATLAVACACARLGPGGRALKTKSVRELVSMLNLSRRDNASARRELGKRGADAVPDMVAELRRLTSGYISEHEAVESTRLIRVFREMGSDGAVAICMDLLVGDSHGIGGIQRARCALLSESLVYLSGCFGSPAVREAYVRFVTERENRYVQRKVHKWHWGAQGEADHLRVDVVSGLPKLVQVDRALGREVLLYLLKSMSRRRYVTTAVCCLDDNGFDIVLADISPEVGPGD